MSSETKQNKIGLSDENEQMKEKDEVAKEEKVEKEKVRVYQFLDPFP